MSERDRFAMVVGYVFLYASAFVMALMAIGFGAVLAVRFLSAVNGWLS